jgi:Viral coat protein P2 N-terminal domain
VIYLNLPPFNPVANGVRSTTQVQRWQLTLGRILLVFEGANSITKTSITEVVVKVGARVIFGPITGAELDKLNKYRGIYDQADRLSIDFTERDALSIVAKEIGGIDLPALGDEDIFVEVVNNAGAGTPALYALGGFTGLQFDPRKPATDGQLVRKVLAYQIPTSGGTAVTWMPDFKGAIIQRVHFSYAGADWAVSTDGNVQRVEVRKNGSAVWDRVRCTDNRFLLREQGKVPQSKFYSLDWVHDNVHSSALSTMDARALEFNLTLGATDTVRAIVECLDLPRNL